MSTQLYDEEGSALYPVIKGDDIKVTWGNSQQSLTTILESISELAQAGSGTSDLATSIEIQSTYAISNSGDLENIKTNTSSMSWGSDFVSPTDEKPYAWKKVIIIIANKQQGPDKYELIASNVQDKTQTIYRATSGAEQPTLTLMYKKDEQGNDTDVLDIDGMNNDNYCPKDWKTEPITISPSSPNVWMAVRNKKQGKWEKFEGPYQYGRWAFDSTFAFKYCITDDIQQPFVERTQSNPNILETTWLDSITEDFEGYLWMISATKVNGVLQTSDGNIWSEPTLLSIVK